jgi:adenine-specific DNA-methyltransferase
VRRLSSKEEKRRIVPSVFDPSKVQGKQIGFENHLNVFHSGKNGLSPNVAKGLALFLGSTLADKWLRRFSGNTQVNASDLRALRYPTVATLMKWGSKVRDELPSQEIIDTIVEGEIK